MIGKMMMTAALALTAAAAPALAQMQPPSTQSTQQTMPQTMPDTTMPSTMSNGMDSMSTSTRKMSKSEMARMKQCKKMNPDAMAKNARCTDLMTKYPDQGTQTPM